MTKILSVLIQSPHRLRGLGVGLALPMLDAMTPALAAAEASVGPQRLIAIQTNQGILPKYFFPEGEGRDYKASPYLQLLDKFRDRMTVFSGVSHPEVDGGHEAEQCFLTAVAASRDGRISQLNLGRSVRRRTDRTPDAVPVACACPSARSEASRTRNPACRFPAKIHHRSCSANCSCKARSRKSRRKSPSFDMDAAFLIRSASEHAN